MAFIKRITTIKELDRHGGRWFIRLYIKDGLIYYSTLKFTGKVYPRKYCQIDTLPGIKVIYTYAREYYLTDLGVISNHAGLYPFSSELLTAIRSKNIEQIQKLVQLEMSDDQRGYWHV